MKLKHLFYTFFLFAPLFFLASCSDDDEYNSPIIGKWVAIGEITYDDRITDNITTLTYTVNGQRKSLRTRALTDTSVLEYTSTGVCMASKNGKQMSKWKFKIGGNRQINYYDFEWVDGNSYPGIVDIYTLNDKQDTVTFEQVEPLLLIPAPSYVYKRIN